MRNRLEESMLDRRNFMKAGLVTTAGLAIGADFICNKSNPFEDLTQDVLNNMPITGGAITESTPTPRPTNPSYNPSQTLYTSEFSYNAYQSGFVAQKEGDFISAVKASPALRLAGTNSQYGACIIYLKFPLPVLLDQDIIEEIEIAMVSHSEPLFQSSGSILASIEHVIDSWSDSSLNYNNLPQPTGLVIRSYKITETQPDQKIIFDLSGDENVDRWIKGRIPDNGLVILPDTSTEFKTFWSSRTFAPPQLRGRVKSINRYSFNNARY